MTYLVIFYGKLTRIFQLSFRKVLVTLKTEESEELLLTFLEIINKS